MNNNAKEIDEPSAERMSFRTTPHVKQIIQRAAVLAGVDDSTFVMEAAFKSAKATIKAHERTELKAVDHVAFFEALNDPPAPNETLREAARQHRRKVFQSTADAN